LIKEGSMGLLRRERLVQPIRTLAALAGLGLLAAGAAAQSPPQAGAPASAIREEWSAAGLSAPAEILIDQWGVPHIYASSARDAFFVQGFNAARDRLWQIDLWRKRGLGRLSSSLGPAYVEQDRAARLFLYRGDIDAEWAAYGPEARPAAESFAAGVNAYVDAVLSGQRPLPVEFQLTDSRPERWAPEDIVRIRSHALVSNVTSEVARARVACAAGLEADRLRRKLEPAHVTRVPAGLDPCDIGPDALADYLLATKAVEFAAPGQQAADAAEPDAALLARIDTERSEGSNNWVVAGSRTTTGRPILANDPHRQLGVPSLRYVAHIEAPGLSLIGAGEPALPGVSLGHNGKAAFGLTIFAMDQEDLYVYRLKDGDPDSYLYRGGWAKMEVVREQIEVKGAAPRTVELRFTRHGPVLQVDAQRDRAIALRSVWMQPGASGYMGSARLWRAQGWSDFLAASHAWGAPPLNLVWADTSGDIGWAASGLAPVRRNWDGLMPVPGDGRYEWRGFHKAGVLPTSRNPSEGFFATANEMNLPQGFPNEDRKISFEWTDRSRIDRIQEVLRAKGAVSLADSMSLQTDAVSPQARRLVGLLGSLRSTDPDTAAALMLLHGWNAELSIESGPAALYEIWAARHLGRATVARATPEPARALVGQGHLPAVIDLLEKPTAAMLGADPAAARDAILLESLAGAFRETRSLLGPDPASWRWGALHRATFTPAIAPLAPPDLAETMTVGPLPTSGSASTPRAQTWRGADFNVVAGASVRMVLDVGGWDNSTFINTPGQSADPTSAHYRDLFPAWAEGAYVPLRFTREAVERDARRIITLTPGSPSPHREAAR
jgi:penicillin G amidase